jgi:hypothetical protein
MSIVLGLLDTPLYFKFKKEDHKEAQEFTYEYSGHQAENSFYSNGKGETRTHG